MGHYTAYLQDKRNLSLFKNGKLLGELIYPKWYSLKANISIEGRPKYQFATKGGWNSKLILQHKAQTFVEVKMVWGGITIKTFFDSKEKKYLLKLKSIYNSKTVLLDSHTNELVSLESDFKWKKLRYKYDFITKPEFDALEEKEILLLAIIHVINYYKTFMIASFS